MSPSRTPAYNLKAVLNETGLSPDTLRAWERRYGLPIPQRTPGGHRLYSHYDIEILKWLMARQAEGLSISRAVELWKDQIASGADPLASLPSSGLSQPIFLAHETSLEAIRARWLEACLAFNETDADQALNQAFALYPLEVACLEVIQRGLSEVGTRWYENTCSVQQEHFASALAGRHLNVLISATPEPHREQTILIGCPANEWHTFTPLLLTLFLRRRGFHVIYLGADVPNAEFETTLSAIGVHLTVLVAHQLITAASLQQTARSLIAHGTPVGFGGRIYNLQPSLIRRTDGQYLGPTLEGCLEEIQMIIDQPSPSQAVGQPSEEDQALLERFKSQRQRIEITLFQSVGDFPLPREVLETATQFLGDNITAALQLGDLALLDGEIDWVRPLLKSNRVPEEALGEYLRSYAKAVEQHVRGQGELITDHLKQQKEPHA